MDEGLRAYMLKVYNYMATGVLLTGIIALLTFKMSVVTDANGSIVALTEVGNAIYLSGLKWITPQFKTNPTEEINVINRIESILKKDTRNKMVITNYPFFSTILNQKLYSPSRLYTGDGTTHPLKDSKYATKYKELMDPKTRKELADYFKPHNQRLFELLGRKFDWDE